MIPLTPGRLAELHGTLSVHCPKCSELRELDLLAFRFGRMDQEFGEMVFRCGCGSLGSPWVSWNDGSGGWTANVRSGVVRERSVPGFYVPAR